MPAVRAWSLVPVTVCLVYLALLAARLPDLLVQMHWVSDSASGFALAEALAGGRGGGDVMLTTTGQYVALWFGLLTADLPFHRELWAIAPYLTYVAGAALIAGSVSRVATPGAAALAAVIVLAASPRVLYMVTRAVSHQHAYLGTAVLGAFVVWLALGRRHARPGSLAIGVAVAVVIGVLAASDAMLAVTGLVPLALLGLAVVTRDRSTALWCWAVTAGAVGVAVATSALMRGAGYRTISPEARLAPLGDIPSHLWWLVEGVARLGNGASAGSGAPSRPLLQALAIALVLAGVAVAAAVAFRGAAAIRRGWAPGDARTAHVAFWALSALCTAGAFVVSGSAMDDGDQYVLTIVFSVAALAPLAVDARRMATAAAGAVAVALFAATSAVGVASGDTERLSHLPVEREADALVAFARSHGVRVGYAGFWEAPNLTWYSRGALDVRPVYTCNNEPGVGPCPFYLMRAKGWYEPAQQSSFLLVSHSTAYVAERPEAFGEPTATLRSGPITMYVYPYDLASRLSPPPN